MRNYETVKLNDVIIKNLWCFKNQRTTYIKIIEICCTTVVRNRISLRIKQLKKKKKIFSSLNRKEIEKFLLIAHVKEISI